MTTLHPTTNRVLFRPDAPESMTAGGLYIPDTGKERPLVGTIVAVGEYRNPATGAIEPPALKVGDRAMIRKYSGNELSIDDEEHMLLSFEDVLGVVTNET